MGLLHAEPGPGSSFCFGTFPFAGVGGGAMEAGPVICYHTHASAESPSAVWEAAVLQATVVMERCTRQMYKQPLPRAAEAVTLRLKGIRENLKTVVPTSKIRNELFLFGKRVWTC